MDDEHWHLLRLRHRVFDPNLPDAGNRLSNLWSNFDTDIFVVIAWRHGTSGYANLIMRLAPKNKVEWLRLPAVVFGCLLVAWIIW
jgi:hypothetical protein